MSEQLTYRSLLTRPHVAAVIMAVTVGRLAAGLVPFGMIATFAAKEQLGWAGAASAAFMGAAALTGPYKGRLVDRVGASKLVIPMAVIFTLTSSGAGVLAHLNYGIPAITMTALAAATAPPNSAILRSVWTAIADTDEENARLHSLDSVVEESTFVLTPLITSGIWLSVGPVWAVIAGSLCALVGTIWFRAQATQLGATTIAMTGTSATERDTTPTTKGSILFTRSGLAILLPMLGLGLAMGTLSVGYPAWGLQIGAPEISGLMMSLESVGGLLGGLAYGRLRTSKVNLWRRYGIVTAIQALGVALIGLTTTVPAVVIVSIIAGLALTPMYIISFLLVGAAVPKHRHTEMNATIGSAYNLGSGAAALLAGYALTSLSLRLVLATAAGMVLATGITALLGQRTPDRAPEPDNLPLT